MTTPVFNPSKKPQLGSGENVEYRTLEAGFGDGYEQVAGDGLNVKGSVHSMSWTGLTIAESKSIRDFMDARGGSEAFEYTPIGESTALKFRCKGYQRTDHSPGRENLSLSLKIAYDV